MARRRGLIAVGSTALALLVADRARRLLTPRAGTIEPAPVALERYFTAAQIERGARFARPQVALALGRAAVDLAALAALTRRPPSLLQRASGHPAITGAAAGAGLAVALSLPPLPLAVISRKRAVEIGLITQSWRDWAIDLLKGGAIQAGFAGGAGASILILTRRYPRGWWLPAAAGSLAFGSLLAALSPVLLDPVFNRFTPLPEGETRSDVLALASAAGVKVGEVYSVDASRRTTGANAYVTGLGPTKRVVLFDTLLDRYSRDEVRVVVAHELAHVRHHDVPRAILYAGLVAPGAAFATQRLSGLLAPMGGSAAALPAIALSASILAAPLGLVGNGLSRAVERRADAFSLELSQAPEAFISFERTIALQNVADLDPPWWIRLLLGTHPPTSERIGFAVSYLRRAGTDTPATTHPP